MKDFCSSMPGSRIQGGLRRKPAAEIIFSLVENLDHRQMLVKGVLYMYGNGNIDTGVVTTSHEDRNGKKNAGKNHPRDGQKIMSDRHMGNGTSTHKGNGISRHTGDITCGHMVVREMPLQERPRERMLKYGPAALSDVELLAIILRTGGSGFTVLDLARQLLAEYNGNIAALFRADIPHLLKVGGIGPAKATQLRSVFELSRRIHTFTPEKKALRSPAQAAAIFIPFFKGEEREKLLLLCLDTKCRFSPGSQIVLSEGSINSSIIDTREIFKKALAHNAASIILLHNHPSGDPAPSREDIDVTRRVVEAGRLLQVPVNDHIIIGDGTYASLRELGYI